MTGTGGDQFATCDLAKSLNAGKVIFSSLRRLGCALCALCFLFFGSGVSSVMLSPIVASIVRSQCGCDSRRDFGVCVKCRARVVHKIETHKTIEPAISHFLPRQHSYFAKSSECGGDGDSCSCEFLLLQSLRPTMAADASRVKHPATIKTTRQQAQRSNWLSQTTVKHIWKERQGGDTTRRLSRSDSVVATFEWGRQQQSRTAQAHQPPAFGEVGATWIAG